MGSPSHYALPFHPHKSDHWLVISRRATAVNADGGHVRQDCIEPRPYFLLILSLGVSRAGLALAKV